MPFRRTLLAALFALALAGSAGAQDAAPVEYRVMFPEAEHHWMEVHATFQTTGLEPLRVRMSRSSPGRYAIHEFAKNVFFLEAFDGRGRPRPTVRVSADEWEVSGHDRTVRVVYRVFGDQADGTYLAIDSTHAHVNMPAAFLWAPGFEDRAVRITFEPPDGSGWRVATQLYGTSDPFSFTAPNFQYFMDSPTELSAFVDATFTLANADGTPRHFRIAAHGGGDRQDVEALARLIERLVREQEAVFGELPVFEPGAYTFVLDYMPWVTADAMEHRNSTFITQPGLSLATPEGRRRALDAISHEFFHVWNVERVRPAGLEPFDFTRANVTCCLWLAEGFTQYYGPLLLTRAGLVSRPPLVHVANTMNAPGTRVRSAVEMSEYAPFADAAVALDVDDSSRTFVSYYVQGAALALALDFSLREHSRGSRSLDDYMRELWRRFGTSSDARAGHVARPYTLEDLRQTLADISGDDQFATTFFRSHVEGREMPDFARLLSLAGYVVRPAAPGRGWIGNVSVAPVREGLEVGADEVGRPAHLVPFETPLYRAGIDAGDVIVSIDDAPATSERWNGIAERTPGSRVILTARRRDGRIVQAPVVVEADPRVEIGAAEGAAGTLGEDARAFRTGWLASRAR